MHSENILRHQQQIYVIKSFTYNNEAVRVYWKMHHNDNNWLVYLPAISHTENKFFHFLTYVPIVIPSRFNLKKIKTDDNTNEFNTYYRYYYRYYHDTTSTARIITINNILGNPLVRLTDIMVFKQIVTNYLSRKR